MIKYQLLFLCIFLSATFLTCKTGNDEPMQKSTFILGHRGSGVSSQSEFQENTYESVLNAFEKLDGAEVDIQCSKDGTLWLFHDADLPENEHNLLCVPQSTDIQITRFAVRSDSFTITPLEEIFVLMASKKITPFLSLDIKGYFNNGCFENSDQLQLYFESMANGLDELLTRYPLHNHIMIETDYQYFLDLIVEQQPGIETYLLGYNDFENRIKTALEKSYDGISFNYKDDNLTDEDLQNARNQNLKVQLWTVYNEDDFTRLMEWKPDFIQTGNVELGEMFMDHLQAQ